MMMTIINEDDKRGVVGCDERDEMRLVPDLEERVPRSSSDGHTVLSDAETAYAIVMSCEDSGAL